VQGWGKYEGPGKVSVEKDGKKSTIEANNILMVSGSEAKALPGIEPDHKTILTNRSILELPGNSQDADCDWRGRRWEWSSHRFSIPLARR